MKKNNFRLNQLARAVALLTFSSSALWAHQAMANCTGEPSNITVSGSVQDCTSTAASLSTVNVQGGATVTHNVTGNATVTNPIAAGANGIQVNGTAALQSKYTLVTTGELNIIAGNGTAGANDWNIKNPGSGRGIWAGGNSQIDITASNVYVETTNGSGNSAVSQGILASGVYSGAAQYPMININADRVEVKTVDKSSGGIHALYGTVNIKGNSGLSTTKVTVSGTNSAGLRAESSDSVNNSKINLEIVDLQAGSGTYTMGILTNGKNASVNLAGGDISTKGISGSGIRTMDRSHVTATGYNNGHFSISTTGSDARGIRATGGSEVAINTDKHANFITSIKTTGLISDGINAGRLGTMHLNGSIHKHAGEIGSEFADNKVTTYGQVNIETTSANSYGIRLIGDGASVSLFGLAGQGRSTVHAKGTSVRFDFGNGYNINPGGTSAKGQAQSAVLENTDLTHTGQSGSYKLSTTCLSSLCDLNGNNTYTDGHLIQVGDHTGDVGVGAQQATVGANNNNGAMTVANVVVDGQLTMRNSTATAIDTKDLLNVTYGGGTSAFLDKKASSSFTLNAADRTVLQGSIFTDTTLDDDPLGSKASSTTLNMNNQSEWYIRSSDASTRDSNVSNLNLANSHVYLNSKDNWYDGAGNIRVDHQPTSYATLQTQTLAGNGSTIYFNSDIVNGVTDKLVVNDTNGASGTHYAYVKNDGGQSTTGTETLTIIETQGGNAQFLSGQTLANGSVVPRQVELGGYLYGIRKQAGTDNWELYGAGKKSNISTTANAGANILNTGYLVTYVDTQTLLQRMGELRNTEGHQGDIWVRGFTGKLSSFGSAKLSGFDMSYNGFQMGVDKQLDLAQGNVYIGVMGGYTQGSPDFNDMSNASGTVKSTHVGLYGTYTDEGTGIYVDGLLKYTRMAHDFSAIDTSGMLVKGDGRTNGYNLSVEAGKRFKPLQSASAFYIEPQVQLSYGKQDGTTIYATNGLRIGLDDYNTLQGRASVIWGYQLESKDNPTNLYLKTGYIKEFKNTSAYRLNGSLEKNDFGGGWVDVGLGVSATIAKRHHVFSELDYSNGSKFNRKQLNLGYRLEF